MVMNPRYERLRKMMAEEGYDVVVAVSPENTLYMAETYIMTQTDIRDRLALVVLPIDKDPTLVACGIEKATIENETWIKDKRYYVEFQQSPIKFLCDVLKEKGYENAKVGIELDYLMAHYYLEMVGLMPKAQFTKCTRIFDKLRMVKEQREIDILEKAAQSTRSSMEKALAETHPGDTEEMFASKVKMNMLRDGADKIAFFVIGTGADSLKAHKLADGTVLKNGEITRIDYGGMYKPSYFSDMARTIVIGDGDPAMVDYVKRFADAYYRTIDMMKPGVQASELFFACEKMMKAHGLEFALPHIGHCLGIGLHEFPMLSPVENFALEENMVFCVEPACTVNGRKIHIEDLIQVTKTGYKVLSEPNFKPGPLFIK